MNRLGIEGEPTPSGELRCLGIDEFGREFSYFMQALTDSSTSWDQVMQMVLTARHRVVGCITEDGFLAWSMEARHSDLLNEVEKRRRPVGAVYGQNRLSGARRPLIRVYSDSAEAIAAFAKYIRRSLSPDTPINLMSYNDTASSGQNHIFRPET